MSIYENAPNNWVTNDIPFDQTQANQDLREKFLEIEALQKADQLNLVIAMGGAPDEQVDIDAESLKMFDADELAMAGSDINLTVDNTTLGVNGIDVGVVASDTWYSIWVIAKQDGTIASLLHAGGTGVIGDLTFPAGYTYARRVGWVLTDATDDFIPGFWIDGGDEFWFDDNQQEYTSSADNKPEVYTDLDLSGSVPPTVNKVFINLARDGVETMYFRRNGSNTGDTEDEDQVFGEQGAIFPLNCDDAQIIEWRVKASDTNKTTINTRGYKDSF